MITSNDICMLRVNIQEIAPGNVHVHSYSVVDINLKCPEDN